jgi:hypothetical protein
MLAMKLSTVQIRVSMEQVRTWFRYHSYEVTGSLKRIKKALGISLEEVMDFVCKDEPDKNHSLVGCPVNFGGGLRTDFDVDGSTMRIRIA